MTAPEGRAPEGGHAHAPQALAAVAAWLRQGLRTAIGLQPQWAGLRATPGVLLFLVLLLAMLALLFERLAIAGPARLHWQALFSGWFGTAALAWVCWLAVPASGDAGHAGHTGQATGARRPAHAGELFTLMAAQMVTISAVAGSAYLRLARYGVLAEVDESATAGAPAWLPWLTWLVVPAWQAVVQLKLVWHQATAAAPARRLACTLLLASVGLQHVVQPAPSWYAEAPGGDAAAAAAPPRLSQAAIEQQAQVLQTRLQAVGAGAPGVVNLFAITYAPYAEADVFQRESELVAGVMQQRFGAAGRSIQLVNHASTASAWPWATPLNLQRAIQRAASVMDRQHDVLFIHLTSHGGADGQLAAAFEPLVAEPVTPSMLKAWLDEAGVRLRVISISACYSGSWLAPLAGPGTLVMTAADATHTSYGCGRKSELTFFGRAMYDEQLRQTWSFEQAHAAARQVIQQREVQAGKDDGFSNPQISVGAEVRKSLALLEAQRSSQPQVQPTGGLR